MGVNATTVELAEWISLLAVAAIWAVVAWLVNAARIVMTDDEKSVNRKHKETRFSTTLSWLAVAALMLSVCILIVWTDEADTTKGSSDITVQYFRWIGIGLYLFFLSWGYANYAGMRETDWRILQLVMLFGGVSGTLSTLVINKEKLQIAGYIFTGFFYALGAFNAFRYTNIKVVGIGWNYLAWFLIYITAPFIFYLLLIFGPEGTRVESRGLTAIGYLVISVSHAIIPGVIIALTFMGTRKLSMDVMTYVLRKRRKVSQSEMTNVANRTIPDELFDTLVKDE